MCSSVPDVGHAIDRARNFPDHGILAEPLQHRWIPPVGAHHEVAAALEVARAKVFGPNATSTSGISSSNAESRWSTGNRPAGPL